MAPRLQQAKIRVILVHIDEAHSTAWPVNIETILGVEQPEPHASFEDRHNRALDFEKKYQPPYPVLIDGVDNSFDTMYQSWPDKFYCFDSELKIVAKSEYHGSGDNDALIVTDYTVVLENLLQQS